MIRFRHIILFYFCFFLFAGSFASFAIKLKTGIQYSVTKEAEEEGEEETGEENKSGSEEKISFDQDADESILFQSEIKTVGDHPRLIKHIAPHLEKPTPPPNHKG